ncbi:alpha/beta hydrolase family protein [Roseibium aggregatum]|uniref:alpha/beta hydrolase family protein n=1 Tax=Roseibium aggregatum TaxID=187304 RepID=UPI003A979280
MKIQSLLLPLVLPLAVIAPAKAQEPVGVQKISVSSKARGEDLTILVWYPAKAGGEQVLIGDDRIFQGTPALADASKVEGTFPLIVLSHGSGASVEKMAWIASGLAGDGFIVAGPNHPGTTSGDSTPEDTPKLWQRTDDLATVIDRLLADPDWSASIDPRKIGALGFSLGGAAVLESAGATASLEAYADYCDTHAKMPDCQWFKGGRAFRDGEELEVEPFDLRTVDKTLFEQARQDARITSVFAVDPALAAAFQEESLAGIGIPLHFINLGKAGQIDAGVRSARLAEAAPEAELDHVADAVHFSFLPVCKADAIAFMKSIGEPDRLCTDGGGRSRAALHEEMAEMILKAFRTDLKTGN